MAKYVMAKDGFIHEHHFAIESDTPVIVIPEADWRRLLEYMGSWQCGCCCEDPCVACQEDAAAAAIIQRTEEANDA